MKHLNFHLIGLLFIIVLSGCATGKKALQKGNYDKAVYQAVQRLRSKDNSKKAKSTLTKAYKYALQMHLANIEQAKSRKDLMMWENIASSYANINSMCDQIMRCPACMEVVPNPRRFDTELMNANKNAAGVRYNLGVEALKFKQNRSKAMEAHQHFVQAQNYVPRYKDTENKIQEALFYATLKVVVEPIPSPFRALDIQHEFFVNKINEYLHNRPINEYVRFYNPTEVESLQLEFVDHVIRMEFDGFSLGNVYNNKTIRDVSRDSVLISGKNEPAVYSTVKAKITEYEKSITGNGVLDFKIFDNSLNKIVTQEKFPSAYTWSVRWASFNGDERALSKEELEMCERTDVPLPNPQWMFEEFTAPIFDQVINKIRIYYRNF